jgi:hypothetical protein
MIGTGYISYCISEIIIAQDKGSRDQKPRDQFEANGIMNWSLLHPAPKKNTLIPKVQLRLSVKSGDYGPRMVSFGIMGASNG